MTIKIIQTVLHLIVIGLLVCLIINNHRLLKKHKADMIDTLKRARTNHLVDLLPTVKDKELRKMITSEIESRT